MIMIPPQKNSSLLDKIGIRVLLSFIYSQIDLPTNSFYKILKQGLYPILPICHNSISLFILLLSTKTAHR